jgi:glutamate dehydrogenase/leucine dehydrogenase
MERSFKEVWDFSQEQGVSLRLGAYMLAVDRVASSVYRAEREMIGRIRV